VAEDAYRKAAGAAVRPVEAEDITGIGRGIAFQLVEALGVLERRYLAEMKDLD
jgi:ATP-dependent RNA helicase SUPV3L1/SUV3